MTFPPVGEPPADEQPPVDPSPLLLADVRELVAAWREGAAARKYDLSRRWPALHRALVDLDGQAFGGDGD